MTSFASPKMTLKALAVDFSKSKSAGISNLRFVGRRYSLDGERPYLAAAVIVSDQVESVIHVPQAIGINFAVNAFVESDGAVIDSGCELVKDSPGEGVDYFL